MKSKGYEIKRIREICLWLHRKMKPTRLEVAYMVQYTARIKVGRKFRVELTIQHQGFNVNDGEHSLQEADWTRLMLARALMRLMEHETGKRFPNSATASRKSRAKAAR